MTPREYRTRYRDRQSEEGAAFWRDWFAAHGKAPPRDEPTDADLSRARRKMRHEAPREAPPPEAPPALQADWDAGEVG